MQELAKREKLNRAAQPKKTRGGVIDITKGGKLNTKDYRIRMVYHL